MSQHIAVTVTYEFVVEDDVAIREAGMEVMRKTGAYPQNWIDTVQFAVASILSIQVPEELLPGLKTEKSKVEYCEMGGPSNPEAPAGESL
jgi:hypothetical protein